MLPACNASIFTVNCSVLITFKWYFLQEKSDDVANKVVSIHKSQKQRKPSANPLGVKRGGVTKRKGLSVDSKPAGEKDEDDMDDDSDLVEEVTADEDNAQVVEEGSGGKKQNLTA